MNIFEELIDELKEERLLETTVNEKPNPQLEKSFYASEDIIEVQTVLGNDEPAHVSADVFQTPPEANFASLNEESVAAETSFASLNEDAKTSIPVLTADDAENYSSLQTQIFNQSNDSNQPVDKAEFYRERAAAEVSSLQMVEHILSGIEREQMKVLPKSYNDLDAKKALHSFLQITADVNSAEHAQAEFQLMQETESWYSSLSHRDKHISAAHLRRYCENARPALSFQALAALARFYRNSPYSESVRNKFDLIITRLFSKDIGDEKREVLLQRDEFIEKLTGLYEEWASISLYSNDEEDSATLLAAFKFEDFMTEADNAENFDELIRNDFFNRLRIFKESTGEQFFAPLVTATAIDSNVRIGNRFVELLNIEREKGEAEKLENKYGFLHDQVISDSTSKTLQLVELLNGKKELTEIVKEKKSAPVGQKTVGKTKTAAENKKENNTSELFSAASKKENRDVFILNKRFFVLAGLVIVAFLGLFVWMNVSSPDEIASNVKKVNLENSSLKEFVREAQINDDTFVGTVQPTWEKLDKAKKEQILKKILSVAGDRGFKNVQLQDAANKTVGSAKENKVEVF